MEAWRRTPTADLRVRNLPKILYPVKGSHLYNYFTMRVAEAPTPPGCIAQYFPANEVISPALLGVCKELLTCILETVFGASQGQYDYCILG